MKLSRTVLAALLALPLAGVAQAADESADQTGIERMPPGAEATPPEAAPAMPADSATSSAAPDAVADKAAASEDSVADPEKAAANADGEAAGKKAGARAEGDATAKDADKSGSANTAEKNAPEAGSDKDHAMGDKDSAPAQDDDPALDRARAQPVEAPAPPAPQDEEPASSRI